eukprot:scaffold9176_cov129-Cylindrotheca_fusiformis.AAC.7
MMGSYYIIHTTMELSRLRWLEKCHPKSIPFMLPDQQGTCRTCRSNTTTLALVRRVPGKSTKQSAKRSRTGIRTGHKT